MTRVLTRCHDTGHTCVMTPEENHTPRRTVRVDDALWNSAQEVAKQKGDSVSDIVRAGLENYVASGYLDKRQPRLIIADTIMELATDLESLRVAYSGEDIDHSAIYADHPLWNLGTPGLLVIEAWLRLELDERRRHWGWPEDPENVMAFDEDDE